MSDAPGTSLHDVLGTVVLVNVPLGAKLGNGACDVCTRLLLPFGVVFDVGSVPGCVFFVDTCLLRLLGVGVFGLAVEVGIGVSNRLSRREVAALCAGAWTGATVWVTAAFSGLCGAGAPWCIAGATGSNRSRGSPKVQRKVNREKVIAITTIREGVRRGIAPAAALAARETFELGKE